ncbi:MAG: hypothetical protein J4G05_04700 [Chlorobi bacterium]|nr:hypothetical protein [Chlorobiota bacterium]
MNQEERRSLTRDKIRKATSKAQIQTAINEAVDGLERDDVNRVSAIIFWEGLCKDIVSIREARRTSRQYHAIRQYHDDYLDLLDFAEELAEEAQEKG